MTTTAHSQTSFVKASSVSSTQAGDFFIGFEFHAAAAATVFAHSSAKTNT